MNYTDHFEIEELVSKEIYNAYGEKACWFLDGRLRILLETMRNRLKTEMVINTWNYTSEQLATLNSKYGMHYADTLRLSARGFREPATANAYGVALSQHRFGRAIDFDAIGITADEVRERIIKDFSIYRIYGLTAIETGIDWVHIDLRYTPGDSLPTNLILFTK
jgi:uncharacterized protein YcbK (DUF882 family)